MCANKNGTKQRHTQTDTSQQIQIHLTHRCTQKACVRQLKLKISENLFSHTKAHACRAQAQKIAKKSKNQRKIQMKMKKKILEKEN